MPLVHPPRLGRWLVVVLCGACAGTEIGNPSEDSSDLRLTAVSSVEAVALTNADAPDADTIVEAAWVAFGDIRFVFDDDCSRDMDSRATVSGPLVVELVSAPPALSGILPRDVDYCRVRIPLVPASDLEEGVPAELADHSVLLTGSHAGVPFSIRTRGRPELELRSMDDPFRLTRDDGVLLLTFDVARWLRGIDLSAAEVDEEGRIVIDEDNQRGLLNLFDDNLRDALTLYRDFDGDGMLDADEEAAPLATARR